MNATVRSKPTKQQSQHGEPELSAKEFQLFQRFIYETAGITMSDAKQALVGGRLSKRLKHYGFRRYEEYFDYIHPSKTGSDHQRERQMAVDLLTTNETHFFREIKHFDFLKETILPNWTRGHRRIWSAACSSGEEPYTLAMILSAHAPTRNWEILGTDISTRVLDQARAGQYPLERARSMPKTYLHQYCLKGIGSKQGTLLVDRALRQQVQFSQANLKNANTELGQFDVIFLRNVMIYFNPETKREVVQRISDRLLPGGLLFIGHSESLHGIDARLELIKPSVYRKHDP